MAHWQRTVVRILIQLSGTYSASVPQADRQRCLQYISCVPLLSTLPQKTESYSLFWLQRKECEFLALFIPCHSLHCWECDLSRKSWALALEVGHLVLLMGVQWTVPLKPQRTCSLLQPSGQSQQGQPVLSQDPSREVFHTHPEHGRELEAVAQAATETWVQPTAAWFLLGWTSFHGLVVPAFHSLQLGGSCNFDLWELFLANRLFFPQYQWHEHSNFPVVNTLSVDKHLFFSIILLLICCYTAVVIVLSVNLYFNS